MLAFFRTFRSGKRPRWKKAGVVWSLEVNPSRSSYSLSHSGVSYRLEVVGCAGGADVAVPLPGRVADLLRQGLCFRCLQVTAHVAS
jgi:hypothetical protein